MMLKCTPVEELLFKENGVPIFHSKQPVRMDQLASKQEKPTGVKANHNTLTRLMTNKILSQSNWYTLTSLVSLRSFRMSLL